MEIKSSDHQFEYFSELKIKVSTKIHYLKEENLSFNQNTMFYDLLEKMSDRRFEHIPKHGKITKGNELRSKNSLSEGYDKREIKVKKKFFMKLRKITTSPQEVSGGF